MLFRKNSHAIIAGKRLIVEIIGSQVVTEAIKTHVFVLSQSFAGKYASLSGCFVRKVRTAVEVSPVGASALHYKFPTVAVASAQSDLPLVIPTD